MELDCGIFFRRERAEKAHHVSIASAISDRNCVKTGVDQCGGLFQQHLFRCHTPTICFVILPRKLMRPVSSKRAVVTRMGWVSAAWAGAVSRAAVMVPVSSRDTIFLLFMLRSSVS